MAFVVPQHLPRSSQNAGYGPTTSHAEPVLRKLSEATHESLTSTEASKWVNELQKNIEETKVCCIILEYVWLVLNVLV